MDIKVLGLGVAAGFVAGWWDKFRAVLGNICALVVRTCEFEERAGYAALMFLAQEAKPIFRTTICFVGDNVYVRPKGRTQLVAFECPSRNETVFYRIGNVPVSISRGWNTVKITFIKHMMTEEDLAKRITECFNRRMSDVEKRRFFVKRLSGSIGEKRPMISMQKKDDDGDGDREDEGIRADKFTARPVGWDIDDIGEPVRRVALSSLELSAEVMNACAYAKTWLEKRAWFIDRLIPWRLGYVFAGAPGTGKTATARAVGQENDLPVFVFDIATMTNNDLIDAWNEMMSWTPCLALFEDVHTVFQGDERILNTGHEAGLNMGTWLNVLDGVENTDGVFSIITTNDLTSLSPALGGPNGNGKTQLRPGRVNRILTFDVLDPTQRQRMATRILPEEAFGAVQQLVNDNPRATGAQFQDVCATYAQEVELA